MVVITHTCTDRQTHTVKTYTGTNRHIHTQTHDQRHTYTHYPFNPTHTHYVHRILWEATAGPS